MSKNILILHGSPKKNGNTTALVDWFTQAARQAHARVEVVHAASLHYKALGCTSCRTCQQRKEYVCVIDDDARSVLAKMTQADVIVFATPLYFFAASAQIKALMDRMFSLYKWDNAANTFDSPLQGKTLAVLASAYEDIGLDALEKPFALTAQYTQMKFASLLIPNAGTSGDIVKNADARQKAIAFGKSLASEE